MSNPLVLTNIENRIATITLNDPESRNPITSSEMVEAIVSNIDNVNNNPDVSVMILTGADPAFSAGGDVKAMAKPSPPFDRPPIGIANSYIEGIQRIPLALYNMDIPTIAAVNGAAIGAGCDLAMMCDMRIASEKAKFGEVFVNLGLIPGDAGSWFMIRRLGYQKCAELTFSGRLVEAQEALELGMVLEVAPHEQLMQQAMERASVIAVKPPQTVRVAKRLMRQAERMDLPDYLSSAAAYQALMHNTEDHKEAITALIDKRDPTFKGK